MKFAARISFLVVPVFAVAVSAMMGFRRDYCELDCNVDGKNLKHILCEFKHLTNAGNCTDIKGKMSPEDRMRILAKHNIERNLMVDAEQAECLRQFRWSYVLEEAAQIYAEQCKETVPYHCARDYVEEYQVWMNIYEEKDPPETGTALVENATNFWLATETSDAGGEDWNFNYALPYAPWAAIFNWQTFELGCGRSGYTKDGGKWGTVVCLYGPGINDVETDNLAVLYTNGSWYLGQGCNPALCENRYLAGVSDLKGDPWPLLCAAPQDEFAWGYQHIPDPSGPDDLEFVAKRSNSSASAHPQLSMFLALSPVFGIVNWREYYSLMTR